ncbi:hypothetical protein BGW39_001588 [Mortierella sp. 14UC]|nr:hypothetical protein BGW39_001588 [Mortierella sp. 14UC]
MLTSIGHKDEPLNSIPVRTDTVVILCKNGASLVDGDVESSPHHHLSLLSSIKFVSIRALWREATRSILPFRPIRRVKIAQPNSPGGLWNLDEDIRKEYDISQEEEDIMAALVKRLHAGKTLTGVLTGKTRKNPECGTDLDCKNCYFMRGKRSRTLSL